MSFSPFSSFKEEFVNILPLCQKSPMEGLSQKITIDWVALTAHIYFSPFGRLVGQGQGASRFGVW
jgi:hypothetical protein